MGASAELIAIIAKQLDITTSKVTDEHIATYNLGKADGSKNNEEAKTPTKTPIDTRSTGAGFDTKGAGPFVDLLENAENLKNALIIIFLPLNNLLVPSTSSCVNFFS